MILFCSPGAIMAAGSQLRAVPAHERVRSVAVEPPAI